MTKLYSTLAWVYHEMYKEFFNYEEEHHFYDSVLRKYNHNSILEIGCGSGMLARRFLKSGYNYLGLDLSDEMLHIARQEVKSGTFVQGDMRNLSIDKQFDAVLITGRSISHNIENDEVINTFKGVHRLLKEKGLLIFDFFHADDVMYDLNDFEQEVNVNNKRIRRQSQLRQNLKTGWTWDWAAKYTIEEEGKTETFDDFVTLRAFTKDEIQLLLRMAGFKIKRVIEERKTITLVTERI